MTKNEIIECASDLFSRYGIKAVNMDEIASKLGASKRTLYESIGSKEELINACIMDKSARLDKQLTSILIIRDTRAALEAIFTLGVSAYTIFYNFSPSFYKDIKNYATANNTMLEKDILAIQNCTKQIYARGVEDGLLKSIEDFEILSTMWKCYHSYNMSEEPSKRVTPELFARVLQTLMQSLVTEQGQDLLRVIKQ
ncbi:MAG: TetR/AcrR family transcriptional regulator [Rikenellaceae bacterium]